MNIGFITTWFERGAAYVSKQYIDLLEKCDHHIFVYARGEKYAKGNPDWDKPNVTWGRKLYDTTIDVRSLTKWIEYNSIECLFFNEQREMQSILKVKIHFPNLKIGTYIDYYTQSSVKDFEYYDFLICNTKRHYSVFSEHPQCYYIPWGTDISKFNYSCRESTQLTFFHSAGLSNRKGTDVLIDAFIEGKLYTQSKLIIHTQMPIEKLTNRSKESFDDFNITIIEKTVPAPGLYHLGDVYVYPTTLDGLGLTMYEALACGLPVIATDCPPMNEVVNNQNGRLVAIKDYKCRWDAYYWPLAFVDKDSLIAAMYYYIENIEKINLYRTEARKCAVENWNWDDRIEEVNNAFVESKIIPRTELEFKEAIKRIDANERKMFGKTIIPFIPYWVQELIFRSR